MTAGATLGVCLALLTGWFDWRQRAVPNLLAYGAIATGILVGLLTGSLVASLPLASIVFVVGLALFSGGRLGGADVKVMTGLALLMGHPLFLHALGWAFACAAPIALLVLVSRQGLQPTIAWLYGSAVQVARGNLSALNEGPPLPWLAFFAAGAVVAMTVAMAAAASGA
jgi:Flp pilus assembly protein protease CpaA